MNDLERQQEQEWLETVLTEAQRQYLESCEGDERLKADAMRTQKELWEEVGPISVANELDQLVEFMEFIGAMKQQKRSHGFLEKQKEKFLKILQSPYFGRIDFAENGQAAPKKYYIGTFNLIDEAYHILIYDWRAPVCGMFYDFEAGPAFYECPKGTVNGELTLKRQYKIAEGKLVYLFDSNLKIDDEMLQQLLGKSADSKMKAIVTSIQREQNRVIRNEQVQNLFVQGPAGSGKTSIALHRAAYLLYKHRNSITPKNILIFSPNAIFNDYISNVLPELGEENLLQTTFEDFMRGALRVNLEKESYYDMMEYLLAGRERPTYGERIACMRFKSSAEFMGLLKDYASYMELNGVRFSDVTFQEKLLISGDELKKLFSEDYAFLPFVRRLEKIRARLLYLLKPMEDARRKQVAEKLAEASNILDRQELNFKAAAIVAKETKEVREFIERLTAFDLVELYRGFFEQLVHIAPEGRREEMERLRAYTLETLDANQLFYEDQISLLFLQGAWGGNSKTSAIRFVIVDEAQDYTPLQYEVFRQLFHDASLTMLGDPNQAIHPYMNAGGYESIANAFPQSSTLFLTLSKSYRSTLEITRFARRLLREKMPAETVERHGEEPIVLAFESEEALQKRVAEDIAALLGAGHASVGILTRTKKEAAAVYHALHRKAPLKSILSGDEDYARGAVVMPAYLAKGLEFDAVIVYNAGNVNYAREEERLLLYTACTRALHALRVYYCGEVSPLIKECCFQAEESAQPQ